MKQTFLSLRDHFAAGLVPTDDARSGAKGLEVCRGLVATEHGLVVDRPLDALSGVTADGWPYSQVIRGANDGFVGGNDRAWRLNADGSTTLLEFTAAEDAASMSAIPSSSRHWVGAAMADVILAANENCLVMNAPHLRDTVSPQPYFLGTTAVPAAMANVGGSMLMGGFSGTRFSTAAWSTLFGEWKAHAREPVSESVDWGPEWVMFGLPHGGSMDMPLALELSMLGYPSSTLPKLHATMVQEFALGRLGFIRTNSPVMAIHQLGNDAIVYSEHGVTRLNSMLGQDGVARWRVQPVLNNVGIPGRGCVAASDGMHLFISGDGDLWALSAEGVQGLGYRQHFALPGYGDVVGTYDPREGDFRFAEPNLSWSRVWRKGALSHSTVNYANAGRDRVGYSTGDGTFEVVTAPLSMNLPGEKTVDTVEIGGRDISDLQVSLYYRNGLSESWAETPAVPAPQGIAFPTIVATDFKLRIRGNHGTNAKLDYAYIRYEVSDFRSIRGLYAQT